MNVNLDDFVVLHQHQAVAQLLEERAQLLRVLPVLPGDNELGAVGEGDVLGVELGEIRLLLRGLPLKILRDGDVLAPQG